MLLRPVDASGDILPVLSSPDLVSGPEAVVVLVRDRLNLLAGEWWENPAWGCEIFDMIRAGRVTENDGRLYLSPDSEQALAAKVSRPEDYPSGPMPENPRWFSPPAFGMTEYADIFTNRQLTALTTFSDLIVKSL